MNALFPGQDREAAEALLLKECGTDLALGKSATAASLERIRIAALKLSNGDLPALRSAVELAKVDWRDLLVAAGFAEDVAAHRSWLPDGHRGETR